MPALGIGEFFNRLPTSDLYLINPLKELRRRKPDFARLRLRNLASNVYLLGKTGVIVRYGRAADIDLLKSNGAARIVYVADDDFTAGADDANLPEPYRQKLAAFAEGAWPILRDAADTVVVPGRVLAGQYGARARIVPPLWRRPPASTKHFANMSRIEIAHLGTGSHTADLAPLIPVLTELLDSQRNVRLTLFAGSAAPEELRRHRQVRVWRPAPWWRYKRALARMRFHLAIYPLADTAFNRARSANKLYEHAVVGAASQMSATPALRVAAGASLSGIFVPGGPDSWRKRLRAFLDSPTAMRGHAELARTHILAGDPGAEAARVWAEILAPEL